MVAQQVGPLLRQKSVVGGQELEHVFFLAGGFGTYDTGGGATPGVGGGGSAIPLGAYYSRKGKMSFRPNPIVVMWASVPLVFLGTVLVRGIVKRRRRNSEQDAD